MDRANNIEGNRIARLGGNTSQVIEYLKEAQLTWIDNGNEVRGQYPNSEEIERLEPFLEANEPGARGLLE